MSEKSTALAVVPQQPRGLQIETMSDLGNFGKMLAASGYFKDARDAAQACVKVQAGLELGIPPVQAMTGIHVVEGKPTLSATLIATLVKRSGKYNYRITQHDEKACAIDFYEGKEKVGASTFSLEDAERAGVTRNPTWTKYRRNMLFARAMSNGARWYCPDIFGGAVYTAEELGAEVDGDGVPVATTVDAPAAQVRPPTPPTPPPADRLPGALAWAWAHLARVTKAAHVSEEADDDMKKGAQEAVVMAREEDAKGCEALRAVDPRLFLAVRAHDDIAEAKVKDVTYEPNDEEREALMWLEAQRRKG